MPRLFQKGINNASYFSEMGMADCVQSIMNLSEMARKSQKDSNRSLLAFYRDRAGLTQTELANQAETKPGTISKLESGEMGLSDDWKQRLAPILNIEPWQLTPGAPHADVTTPKIGRISVIGSVEAGVWREAVEWAPHEGDTLPIAGDEYANCYALKVGGDSMNKFYAEGDFVIVCPLEHYPDRLRSEEHVIVRRVKKDGSVEATVKELVIVDGKAELWPRSDNPKYQSPIDIHWPYQDPQKSGTELVEICGVVVTSYRVRRKL